jgi:hypothetical protein
MAYHFSIINPIALAMDEEDETPILEVDLIQTHSIKFLKEESNHILFKLDNKVEPQILQSDFYFQA